VVEPEEPSEHPDRQRLAELGHQLGVRPSFEAIEERAGDLLRPRRRVVSDGGRAQPSQDARTLETMALGGDGQHAGAERVEQRRELVRRLERVVVHENGLHVLEPCHHRRADRREPDHGVRLAQTGVVRVGIGLRVCERDVAGGHWLHARTRRAASA
jgi:hypothetical protein